MKFHPTALHGAQLIHLEPAYDNRGFFARTFCSREFAAHGLETNFPQHSVSLSGRKGTVRGLHYQRDDLAGDGTHPSSAGREKVARFMLEFFKTDPLAKVWFAR